MCRTRMVCSVERLSSGPRYLFPMSELFRPLFHISILHIFPLHTDYGQDGADDEQNPDSKNENSHENDCTQKSLRMTGFGAHVYSIHVMI